MSEVAPTQRTVVEGLVFGEGPRWHEGALWFSDIHGGAVHRVAGGEDAVVVAIDEQPSGLGWLPDGSLVVVAMGTSRLLRLGETGGLVLHADLTPFVRGVPNDMIVRSDGTAFVGDMGARIFDEEPDHSVPGQLLVVSPEGRVAVARDGLRAPNGMVLTDDERTLILAESGGLRLLGFSVAPDGSLGDEWVFAELHPSDPAARVSAPDGICLDAEGAIWVADPVGRRVLRVLDGGAVTDEVHLADLTPVACVLGGPDRRTLFVCAAQGWRRHDVLANPSGRILAFDVPVPGAGAP